PPPPGHLASPRLPLLVGRQRPPRRQGREHLQPAARLVVQREPLAGYGKEQPGHLLGGHPRQGPTPFVGGPEQLLLAVGVERQQVEVSRRRQLHPDRHRVAEARRERLLPDRPFGLRQAVRRPRVVHHPQRVDRQRRRRLLVRQGALVRRPRSPPRQPQSD